MADNFTADVGSGGDTFGADDIGGIKFPRSKLIIGADGTNDGDVSSSNPLPVNGTVTANLGATDNAVLDTIDAVLDTINAKLASGTVIGDVNLGATDNAVLDSIVSELQGTLTVTGGGGGTEYNEDDATPATITASSLLMERDDALSAVTPIEGDWIGLRGSAEGALWTQDFNSDASLAALQGTLSVDGSAVTQPISGTVTANLSATDNAVLDAIDAVLDTINAKLASGTTIGDVNVVGDALTALQLLDNAISGNEMQVDVVAALPAGASVIGDVGISGARTSGGTTLYKNIDVDESEDQVKGTAGQVYWIHAINLKAAPLFLKLYNATAASVTVGTTVPDLTFPVPSQGDTNGAGFTLSIPNGIAFGTAITIAGTTGVADADSGAPGANELIVNLGYA